MHLSIMKTAFRSWFKSSLTWVPGSTQVIKFGNKHLYLLSCLTGPKSISTGLARVGQHSIVNQNLCASDLSRGSCHREKGFVSYSGGCGWRIMDLRSGSGQAYSDPVSRSRNKNKPHSRQSKAATESWSDRKITDPPVLGSYSPPPAGCPAGLELPV